MKIVLDCNVIISAGLAERGTCRKAIIKAFDRYEVIVTNAIITEYKTVGAREKFALFKHVIFDLIEIIESSALRINNKIVEDIILPDASDEIYIHAAINSQAKYLVTGNIKHFSQEICSPVEILLPKAFLNN